MTQENINLELSTLSNIGADENFLRLSPIKVKEDYLKKWNESSRDFVCLTKNGELVNNNLYRMGGINFPNPKVDNYFMLLKYVEAFYSSDIMRMSKTKDPKHLDGRWVIIDKNGIEKVEFDQFKHGHIVKDSCIYSLGNNYYNIETGELYCSSYSSMESGDYLFLDNRFDKDKSRCGVMKINKKDGTWELFPQ